jgi:hypothetical protein
MTKVLEIPEEIFEYVKYDESSPSGLKWIKPKQGRKLGGVAGSKDKNGYWQIRFSGKRYLCHRVIYKMFNKINIQNFQIDHIDNNPSNNNIENLRIATASQNSFNQKISSKNTSGIKGVYWNKNANKWKAQIMKNGKSHFLGYFDNLEDVRIAVEKARKEMHGEFANHGGVNISAEKTLKPENLTIFDI